MKVTVDTHAWLPKDEFTADALEDMRRRFTITPIVAKGYGDETPEPLPLFVEMEHFFGVPRAYFMQFATQKHEITMRVSDGNKHAGWPGKLTFVGELREEQALGVRTIVKAFREGSLGGILQAACGWGKTVASCALIAELDVPTLVTVHKEFLMEQWRDRIQQFLPDAKIGIAQQDTCDFVGKHIVIGMIHSLTGRDYGETFRQWPGLVLTDETHRVAARSWSPLPGLFPARWRLGVSATPRRKDGADNVFWWNIGRVLFRSSDARMAPRVRRVFTTFKLVKTPRFNPNLAPKSLVTNFLIASESRNRLIVEQMILALKTGRKLLVLSERLKHLDNLSDMMRKTWTAEDGPYPTMGLYVGGMTEETRAVSAKCQVLLATFQYAAEGLDVPTLDTAFLVTPASDVEQAVGRILRPVEGKKPPVVVDFRDDNVPMFARMADGRERVYAKLKAT